MGVEEERVEVDLDMRGYLAANAEEAATALDRMGKNLRQVNRALLLFDRRVNKSAASLMKLTSATEAYNAVSKQNIGQMSSMNDKYQQFSKETDRARRSVRDYNEELDRNRKHLKDAENKTKRLSGALKMLRTVAMKVLISMVALSAILGIVGLAAKVPVLTQYIGGLSAALYTMVSFAALIPTALGSIVLSMVALKVVTAGVGTAMRDVAQNGGKKLGKALEKLSPAAQQFVKSYASVYPQIKKTKEFIQNQFFIPLNKSFKKAITAQLPIWKTGMGQIASIFGSTMSDIMAFTASPAGKGMFSDLFKAGEDAADALHKAALPLLQGIADVIHAIAPEWTKMSISAGNLATKTGEWLSQISKSGKLVDWLHQGEKAGKDLWETLKLLGTITKNVFDVLGTKGFDALNSILTVLAEFTGSVKGSEALATFFNALATDAEVLAPLFSVVAEAISGFLAPAIQGIVTGLGPGFTEFLNQLGIALQIIAPYFRPLSEAIGDVLTALAPLLPVIGELAKLAASEVVVAIKVLVAVIKPLVTVLATLLSPWLETVQKLVDQMTPYIEQLADAFAQGFIGLLPVMAEIGQTWMTSMQPFFTELAKIMPELMPVLVQLAMSLGTILVAALQELLPYLPELFDSLVDLMIATVQLLPGLVPLIDDFVQMTPAIVEILPHATFLIKQVLIMASVFLRLLGVVQSVAQVGLPIVEFFVGGIIAKFNLLKDAVSTVWNFIGRLIKDTIEDIKRGIEGLKSAVSSVGGFLSKLNPFKFAGGPVEAGVTYTVGEIGKELFIPNNGGRPQVIGATGMENRSFPTGGTIIPNHIVRALEDIETKMRSGMDRSVGAVLESNKPDPSTVNNNGDTYHYHVTVPVSGDAKNVDYDAIDRAVGRAIDRIERDRKERG